MKFNLKNILLLLANCIFSVIIPIVNYGEIYEEEKQISEI